MNNTGLQGLDLSRPAFAMQGLTKVFGSGPSRVEALRGVDLTVPAAELVVLLGPSGSGKSTLLNILGGLDSATSGSLFYFNQDLGGMDESELTQYRRQHIGFVFQFYNLMPSLTALENVQLVTEIAENPMDAAEALAMVGLENRQDHFPAQLSGGEQQRVAIARAIVKRPRVLFCDEPTGALDSKTGRTVLNVLQEVNRELGTTIFIVTHAASTAAMAHRVIHFADGRISKEVENQHVLSAAEIDW